VPYAREEDLRRTQRPPIFDRGTLAGIVVDILREQSASISSKDLANILAERYPEQTRDVPMDDLKQTASAALSELFRSNDRVERHRAGRFYLYFFRHSSDQDPTESGDPPQDDEGGFLTPEKVFGDGEGGSE